MIIVLLISILGVMLVWTTFYRMLWEKRLFVKFEFEQPYVYEGEYVQLNEIIENRKRMPVAPLEISFRIKKGLFFTENDSDYVSDYAYKKDIYALIGRRRIARNLSILCKKRGIYAIEDVSLLANSLMFDKTYRKELNTDTQLYVYAKRTKVDDIVETIARTSDLTADNYVFEKNERIMIYLDIEDKGISKNEELKEYIISVAASLYEELLNKTKEVGICINIIDEKNEKIFNLQPSCNESCRTELEQILASELDEAYILDFEKALEIKFDNAKPVIISKNTSLDRIRIGEKLCKNKSKGIWIIPHERGEIPSVDSDSFMFIKREVY